MSDYELVRQLRIKFGPLRAAFMQAIADIEDEDLADRVMQAERHLDNAYAEVIKLHRELKRQQVEANR